MRNNKKHKSNGNVKSYSSQLVHVKFHYPAASAVSIAGTFNDWRPEITPMLAIDAGDWRKDLSLAPGTYEYLFVADGKWLTDPLAKETVPNPFGGKNSLLIVPKPGNGSS